MGLRIQIAVFSPEMKASARRRAFFTLVPAAFMTSLKLIGNITFSFN